MDGYFIYVCPECKKVFKVQGNDKKVKCSKCGVLLIDTKEAFEDWNTLSADKKAEIKKKVCSQANPIVVNENKKPITITCPQCGSEVNRDSKFCTYCGHDFMQNSAPISAGANSSSSGQTSKSASFFSGYEDKVNTTQPNTKQPKVNLMKCPNCGADIDIKSKQCLYCNAFITSEMRKEKEMVLKEGCPKCGSSNIQFKRERQGEIKRKNNKKEKRKIVYKTVGLCNDCGYTWNATAKGVNYSSEKSSFDWKMLMWVLGWIYIFPVPLMLLLKRNNIWDQKLKKGIIIAAWAVYALFFGGSFILALNSSDNDSSKVAVSEDINRGIPEDMAVADQNIKELSFLKMDDINVNVGQTTGYGIGYLKVDVEDKDSFKPEDVEFISENPQIAKIAFREDALKTTLYFDVTGVSGGETHIYASSKDGNIVSEKIKVNVAFPDEGRQARQDEEPTRNSLGADESDEEVETAQPTKSLFATDVVNLREQPNTNSSSLGKLSVGEEVMVYETTSNGWSKVSYNGSDGYVKSEYLSDTVQVSEVPKNDVTRSTNNTETNDGGASEDTNRTIGSEANAIEANSGTGKGNPNAFDSYVPTGAPAGSSIIVNAKNGKIHDSGCRKLPNEENRIYFNSLQDALNAGYSDGCGICNPL